MFEPNTNATVSRRRYERQKQAREEAERLLDAKSRELWTLNEQLKQQADALERKVETRTAELHRATLAAEHSNRAKSIFLATMSHEIRTPLNGVLGLAEALSEMELPQEQAAMAAIIVESGEILLSVLNDILDVSKIEAGQMSFETIPFDVVKLFETTKLLYALKAREKDLEFDIEVAPSAQCWINGDPVRLRQITGNLISNAIKFTSQGAVHVRVEIPNTQDQDMLQISVTDTGPGIAHDQLNDLGRPFHQLDASVNRTHGGSGLGLVITKQICELLGGALTIQSTLGAGSLFAATLRVARAPDGQDMPVSLSTTDHIETILRARPWRILIAEDNKTNRFVLSKQLKGYDLDISYVNNGLETINAMEKCDFDVVLMDLNMPKLGGIETTIRIRSLERKMQRTQVPIIALTANSMPHHIASCLTSGMDAHLAKPVKKAALLKALARALGGSESNKSKWYG